MTELFPMLFRNFWILGVIVLKFATLVGATASIISFVMMN